MSAAKKLVRERFRDAVFARDKHKCCFCERTDDLDAHHISDRNEMPNGGYVKENGITLCPQHHAWAEEYHSSAKATWHDGFHPNDLYRRIKSSYERAVTAAKRLAA